MENELELMNENENREFYVYVHIRLDNNTVFYVGKGTKNRAYNLSRGEGTHHDNICKACCCKAVIIKNNLTESQAFRLESKMIEYYVHTLGYGIDIEGYDDYDHKLPHLANRDWGGRGGKKGINPYADKTPEEIEIINKKKSEAMKGEKHPLYGKHHTDEAKRKMSEKRKGKITWMKGKHHTDEAKRKMSEKKKGKNHPMYGKHRSDEAKRKTSEANSKKVICITTGETFDSIKEAGDHYNVAPNNISICCRKKIKHAGKLNGIRLQWKYLEDDDNNLKAV